jgi:1-deoxy-D-xylulose-5-phosphate reductoisomerase
MAIKTVSILGATGSIGASTLDLIRHHKNNFDVRVLTAGSNVDRLIELAAEFQPQYVGLADETKHGKFHSEHPDIEIVSVEDAAMIDSDWTMAAIVGMAGLKPTMNAIKRGKTVAFASKECLVGAGDLMMNAVRKYGTILLPVDSEHNAIFQVFDDTQKETIKRLILTCSGGPFRTWDTSDMMRATVEQALKHPTWSMGAKISIDSASLMNKALEVIEAKYLFGIPSDQIDIIVHPQSLIHSMVEYNDGSILSQMGPSDMRTPIAYCLGWPNRIETSGAPLSFDEITNGLTFETPDVEKFASLKMMREVLKADQDSCIGFNAANEIAVQAFLNKQISFGDIFNIIETCLEMMERQPILSLDDVVQCDENTRNLAIEIIETKDRKTTYA